MASTNIYKNPSTTSFAPTDGGAAVGTLTSVLQISVTDNTQFERDGSDNDSSATFVQRKANQCRVQIDFRDVIQADKLARRRGDLTWTEAAAQGTASNRVAYGVTFGQVPRQGRWDELATFQMNGEGGWVGLAGASS